jgi:ribonucleoside-diphosphate reductase alpha chain
MMSAAPIMVAQPATPVSGPDLSGVIACSIDNPECEACQ